MYVVKPKPFYAVAHYTLSARTERKIRTMKLEYGKRGQLHLSIYSVNLLKSATHLDSRTEYRPKPFVYAINFPHQLEVAVPLAIHLFPVGVKLTNTRLHTGKDTYSGSIILLQRSSASTYLFKLYTSR